MSFSMLKKKVQSRILKPMILHEVKQRFTKLSPKEKNLFTFFLTLFISIFLAGFLSFLFLFFYLPHIGAFGCFDDCNNIIGGFFILKGKKIFTDFYFNHQLGMAYVSFFTQYFFHPETLYKLLLYHRVVVFLWSLFFSIWLFLRFRFSVLFFILLFAITKFYVFGDRFLAESFIIYPLVYILCLLWYQQTKQRIYRWEYVLTALFVWFIIFMREPFIPLALFLFAALIWKAEKKMQIISLGILSGLTVVTISFFSLKDMYQQLVVINQQLVSQEVGENQTGGIGILKIFFYPLFVLTSFPKTMLGQIEIDLSILFFAFAFYQTLVGKKYKELFLFLFVLGIACIRFVQPGTMFYHGFRLMVWYGLFITFVNLLIMSSPRRFKTIGITLFIVLILFSVFSPKSFMKEKINREEAFTVGYGHYFATGTVVKTLAKKDDTLFVEARDDMIYWQADIKSAYKYQFYTGLMPSQKLYVDARTEMFGKYPPDFYYGDCDEKTMRAKSLPKNRETDYQQIYFSEKPSCLYIKKGNVSKLTKQQLEQIQSLGYTIPR